MMFGEFNVYDSKKTEGDNILGTNRHFQPSWIGNPIGICKISETQLKSLDFLKKRIEFI